MFENHTTTVRRDQHLRISSHDLLITCHLGRRWAGTGRYYWRYEQQLLLNASDATFYIYLLVVHVRRLPFDLFITQRACISPQIILSHLEASLSKSS